MFRAQRRSTRLPAGSRHLIALLGAAILALALSQAFAWYRAPPAKDGTPMACTVAGVIDGDTMDLICNRRKVRVRLHCIDAPELEQAPWGEASRAYLRSITPRSVVLVPKTTKYGFKDRFGRTVGEVLTSEDTPRNLNISQVFAGHAAVYSRYCQDDRYYWTEQVAQSAKSGIWAKSGPHQTPWRSRH